MHRIFHDFLVHQEMEARSLSQASDLVSILPVGGDPPHQYVLDFRCVGLVLEDGAIREADRFLVGLRFPESYLRHVIPGSVVTLLAPSTVFHPNVRFPNRLCIGDIPPGTGIVDLTYQVFEILTYNKVTMDERDAWNPEACRWARRHIEQFPLDPRPLTRPGARRSAQSTGADGAVPEGSREGRG